MMIEGDFALAVPKAVEYEAACASNEEVQIALRDSVVAHLSLAGTVLSQHVGVSCRLPARRLALDGGKQAGGGDVIHDYVIYVSPAQSQVVFNTVEASLGASASPEGLSSLVQEVKQQLSNVSGMAHNVPTGASGGWLSSGLAPVTNTTVSVTDTTTSATATHTTTITKTKTLPTTRSIQRRTTTRTLNMEAGFAQMEEAAAAADSQLLDELWSTLDLAQVPLPSSSSAVVAEVQQTSFVGTTVAAALATSMAIGDENTTGKVAEVSVSDGDGNVKVKVVVPLAVVSQASRVDDSAIISAVVTIFDDKVLDLFKGGQTATAASVGRVDVRTAPVSISFHSGSGEILAGVELVEPILITLAPNKSHRGACAYWANGSWAFDGVEEVVHDGPELICRTNHLTMFSFVSAVVNEFEKALVCSNIKLLEHVEFGDPAWLSYPATIAFMVVLLMYGVLLPMAYCQDRKHRREGFWVDDALLTDNPAYKRESLADRLVGILEELLIFGYFTKQCGYSALAHALKIDAATLELVQKGVLKGAGSERADRVDVAGGSWIDSVGVNSRPADVKFKILAEKICAAAPEVNQRFWRQGLARRTGLLFYAQHGLFNKVFFFDFRLSCTARALVLTAKVMGSLGLNALFFATEGGGLGKDSDPDCETKSTWELVLRHVAVGILTAVLSTIPITLATYLFAQRSFIYRDDWTSGRRRVTALLWMCTNVCYIWLLGLYSLFMVLFVLVFLSRATKGTGVSWAVSCAAALLKDLLLLPLILCLLLSLGAKIHSECDPGARKRVHERFFDGSPQKIRSAGPGPMEALASRDGVAGDLSGRRRLSQQRPRTTPAGPFAPVVPSAAPRSQQPREGLPPITEAWGVLRLPPGASADVVPFSPHR